MAAPAQADIVRELYSRRDSLPADKRAIVDELHARFNPGGDAPGIPNPLQANPAKYTPSGLQEIQPNFWTSPTGLIRTGGRQIAEGVEAAAQPGLNAKIGGVTRAAEGAGKALLPAAIGATLPALVANPVGTATGIAAGTAAGAGAQAGVESGSSYFGASPELSRALGDLAGLVAGGSVGKLGTMIREARINPTLRRYLVNAIPGFGKAINAYIDRAPLPGESGPGPYFSERSTVDPQFRGAVSPAPPGTPAHGTGPAQAPPPQPSGLTRNATKGQVPPTVGPNTTGTVNVPAPPPQTVPGTAGPAGRVNPSMRATGTPPTGTVNIPPTPQPSGMTQDATGPLVSPVATKPPSQVFVGSSGTIPGKVVTDAPVAASMAPQPSPKGKLQSPLQPKFAPAPADASSYLNDALSNVDQQAAEGAKTRSLGEHNFDAEHKAINIAREAYEQGYTPEQYDAIIKNQDWKTLQKIQNDAFTNGAVGKFPSDRLPGRNGVRTRTGVGGKAIGYDPVDPAKFADYTTNLTRQHLENFWNAAPQSNGPLRASPANELKPPDFSQSQNIPGASGNQATVYTPSEIRMDTQYRVVPLDSLKTSFDEGYPQELQPRDTDRIGSRQRIEKTKSELNNEKMGESVNAGDGAPIVLPDGSVVTRNHGTQAIRELYGAGSPKAAAYKQWITENAPRFGMQPDAVTSIDRPVLVRQIQSNPSTPELQKFAEDANMSTTARMSDAEQAQMLSKRMTGDVMEQFDPKEDGTPNPEFVQAILKGLPAQEQAGFQDAYGRISQNGIRLIRNAIFAKAYPDISAIERMAESTDDSVKNVTIGMLSAAPKVARLQEEISRGNRYPLGLAQDASEAAAAIEEMKNSGMSTDHWLAQQPMFGRDPVVDALVKIFTEHKRSARAIGDLLREYTDLVDQAGNPNQERLFGGANPPNKLELLEAANGAIQRRIANKKAANTPQELFGPQSEAGGGGTAIGTLKNPR